jgi:hypothetical protein
MNLLREIKLKSLLFFIVLYSIGFYLLNLVYIKIMFAFFKDIQKIKSDPNAFDLHSSVNQQRIIYFDLLFFYKSLIIYFILMLTVVFLKFSKNKYYKEALLALILHMILHFTLTRLY